MGNIEDMGNETIESYAWQEDGREFYLREDGYLFEEGEPGNSAPQAGYIPVFVAREFLRLVLRNQRVEKEAEIYQANIVEET